MDRTALTVGGFTQPVTAQSLIELPSSIEKGLTQRFLWICPSPSYSKLENLELVDEDFITFLVRRLALLWQASDEIRSLTIPEDCPEFSDYHDAVQEKISQVSVLDELLAGMLSKSKGQVLRVAACLHVISFELDEEESSDISTVISKEAILATENFVTTCCQHAAFMAGRGKIEEEVTKLSAGLSNPSSSTENKTLASFCLLLPGRELNLSALLAAKKFRRQGNKEVALLAFKELEAARLGDLKSERKHHGVSAAYKFYKKRVENDNLEEIADKLMNYGVSVREYESSMKVPDSSTQSVRKSPRKSPRKRPFAED